MTWPTPEQALTVGTALVKATGVDLIALSGDIWRLLSKGRMNIFLVGCV